MSHPRIVQWDWKRSVPQFVAIISLVAVFYWLLPDGKKPDAIVYGAIFYLVYSTLSRKIIPHYHRKGVRLMFKGNYPDSIELFQKSVVFFEKYWWLDKYRSIFLMSSSSFTYREMALMNIAYAYSQINEEKKAEEYYTKILNEYPNNQPAKSALNLINAGKEIV